MLGNGMEAEKENNRNVETERESAREGESVCLMKHNNFENSGHRIHIIHMHSTEHGTIVEERSDVW